MKLIEKYLNNNKKKHTSSSTYIYTTRYIFFASIKFGANANYFLARILEDFSNMREDKVCVPDERKKMFPSRVECIFTKGRWFVLISRPTSPLTTPTTQGRTQNEMSEK